MVGSDIIKEYLVKLGFDVDNEAQRKLKEVMNELEKQLNGLTKNKAAAVLTNSMFAFTGAIATAVTATTELVRRVAEADLEYEKLALNMHMSKEAAKELTIAQKALGASLEEIAWNPELRKHYHEIRQLVREVAAPKDFGEQMKFVRSIFFEFTKLRVMVGGASQWIAYHLTKHFGGSLKELKHQLEGVNAWIKQNMPKITAVIASGIVHITGVGKVLFGVGKSLVGIIHSLIDVLPKAGQAFVGFAAVALGAFKLNPIFLMLMSLFMLLNDYWVWAENKKIGRKPEVLFGSLWDALEKIQGDLSPAFDSLRENVKKLLDIKGDLGFWEKFGDVLGFIGNALVKIGGGIGAFATMMSMLFGWSAERRDLNDKMQKELSEAGITEGDIAGMFWGTTNKAKKAKFEAIRKKYDALKDMVGDKYIFSAAEQMAVHRKNIGFGLGYGGGSREPSGTTNEQIVYNFNFDIGQVVAADAEDFTIQAKHRVAQKIKGMKQ